MSPDQIASFREWGEPLPTRDAHGTDNDIRSNLKSVNPHNWRLEGNQLIADTEVGRLVQTIPTTHILMGTDAQGLPIFKQV